MLPKELLCARTGPEKFVIQHFRIVYFVPGVSFPSNWQIPPHQFIISVSQETVQLTFPSWQGHLQSQCWFAEHIKLEQSNTHSPTSFYNIRL